MAEKKEKQYVSDNAQLMAEWDWEKNNTLGFAPNEITSHSGKKVWWICINGHSFNATIANRVNGKGCPYCAGQKVWKGDNDLATVNPDLAQEWHPDKNVPLKPQDVTANSGQKVWWQCKKGHEWQAAIGNRNQGSRCPYCAGKKVKKGDNDLQTLNPTLASEWNYEKNGGLKPESFTARSNKKVWWKCSKGHEWQAVIANRNNGDGCPVCNAERHTSFPEYAIVYYLRRYGLEAIHLYKARGYELDVYIPSKRIAIEYDGYLWHKNKTKQDLAKNYKCVKDEIKLYRIREGLPPLNDSSVDYIVQKYQTDLSEILKKCLSEIIGTDIDVDIKRDAITIENLREHVEKEASFLLYSPEAAKEWNYEKNGKLKPESFTANSNKKVWWKCSKGHEWQAIIANRNKGIGCPYCSGRYVVKGETDLQTINPTLAKEWNYEKNNGLRPDNFTENSGQMVWWKCSKGHEWQARIADRNRGRGCPYCSGRYVVKGENDLQTVNPILAKEWNYEKNNGLTPADVMPNSGKKVWWKCSEGHEWQATIDHRNKGTGCPQCTREKRKSAK